MDISQTRYDGWAFQLGYSEILSRVNYGCGVQILVIDWATESVSDKRIITNIDDSDFVNDLVLLCTR